MDKKLWLNIKNFNSIFETSLNLNKECIRCYLKLPSMKLAIYVRRSRNTSCLFQYHWKSILWQYMFVAINVSRKHLLPQIFLMINKIIGRYLFNISKIYINYRHTFFHQDSNNNQDVYRNILERHICLCTCHRIPRCW